MSIQLKYRNLVYRQIPSGVYNIQFPLIFPRLIPVIDTYFKNEITFMEIWAIWPSRLRAKSSSKK